MQQRYWLKGGSELAIAFNETQSKQFRNDYERITEGISEGQQPCVTDEIKTTGTKTSGIQFSTRTNNIARPAVSPEINSFCYIS